MDKQVGRLRPRPKAPPFGLLSQQAARHLAEPGRTGAGLAAGPRRALPGRKSLRRARASPIRQPVSAAKRISAAQLGRLAARRVSAPPRRRRSAAKRRCAEKPDRRRRITAQGAAPGARMPTSMAWRRMAKACGRASGACFSLDSPHAQQSKLNDRSTNERALRSGRRTRPGASWTWGGHLREATGMQGRVIPSALALALPFAALAQEAEDEPAAPTLTLGVVAASEYVSEGTRQTDGVAVQPYFELGFGGFYAGGYASNLDEDLTGADAEYGLNAGYRGEAGRLSYDVSYAYYFFNEAFDGFPVENYGEFGVKASYAVTGAVYLTATAAFAPEFDQTINTLALTYYTPVEGLSVGPKGGRLEADYGDWSFWSLEANYQVNEHIGLGLAYHDSDVDEAVFRNTDGLVVATMTVAFSLP
jgi:uncharacterized protein (TIGR02001 family)